jgi:hypothetical protein
MSPDDSGVFDAALATAKTDPCPPPEMPPPSGPPRSGQFEVPSLHQLAREVGAELYDEDI